jgi:YD repeat-containing protein
MGREHPMRWLCQIIATSLLGISPFRTTSLWGAERLPAPDEEHTVEHAVGSVQQLIVSTKESIATLRFSPLGTLIQKVTTSRADSSDGAGETLLYRYDTQGRRIGEYLADTDDELVPLRLYAYNSQGRLSAEGLSYMPDVFCPSGLHVR